MSSKKESKEINNYMRELAELCNPFEPIMDTTKMTGEIIILSGLDCNTKEIEKNSVYEVTYEHYRWINPYRQMKKLISKCKTEDEKKLTLTRFLQAHL